MAYDATEYRLRLTEASAELTRASDLQEVLAASADALCAIQAVSSAIILVGRGELGPYRCLAAKGMPAADARRLMRTEFPLPLWGVLARALVSRRELIISEAVGEARPQPQEFDWDYGESLLILPASSPQGLATIVLVGGRRKDTFGAGPVRDYLLTLARMAGLAILNSALHGELATIQERLVTLQVSSRELISGVDANTALQTIVSEAAELKQEGAAWLHLVGQSGGKLRLHSRSGARAVELWSPVHDEAVRWVMEACQPIFFDPQYPLSQSPRWVHSGPALCVPLETMDEPVGALLVSTGHTDNMYIEEDMVMLRVLANHAAVLHSQRSAYAIDTRQYRMDWRAQIDM